MNRRDPFGNVSKTKEFNNCYYSDDNYFKNLNLYDDKEKHVENLGIINHRIMSFYQYIINSQVQDNWFNPSLETEINFIHLGELITGLTAQCPNREKYITTMTHLNEKSSTELTYILDELIPMPEEESTPFRNCSWKQKDSLNKSISVGKKEYDDEDREADNIMLMIRAEGAEKEVVWLNKKIEELNDKNNELVKSNYNYEIALEEMKANYQQWVLSMQNFNEVTQHDQNENMTLSMQLSEWKGKWEAKEKSFSMYRDDKEKLIEELKNQVANLSKDNSVLKEKTGKYEVWKQHMKKHSIEEMNAIKQKLADVQRINKDQEDLIRKWKSYDDKNILLKKWEELNRDIELIKEKKSEIEKENEKYRHQIISNETEITSLKTSLSRNGNPDDSSNLVNMLNEEDMSKDKSINMNQQSSWISLEKIEEMESMKLKLWEYDTKIKVYQSDKDLLSKDKNDLTEKVNALIQSVEEQKTIIDQLTKKKEKYSVVKNENKAYVAKIQTWSEKLENYKKDNEDWKDGKSTWEAGHTAEINKLNLLIQDGEYKIKEWENKIQFINKENENYEKQIQMNQSLITDLQAKWSNISIISTPTTEFEKKLKEWTENENNELKKKIHEKEEMISKQSEKIKRVDMELKELNIKIEKIPNELGKRDEAIEYYKNQLEQKENIYNEEIRWLSNMFHNMAYQCAVIQEKVKNPSWTLS